MDRARLRALVVGYGSIGRRHARNLRELGVGYVAAVDPAPASRAGVDALFPDLGAASLAGHDLVLVCTPSIQHVEAAAAALAAGCHVFVEKPLATSVAQAAPLAAAQAASGRVLMTACNMRFHPAPRRVRDLVAGGTLGAPLGYAFHAASWLPHWKPGTDWRASYSARSALGGGALLDCIHEVDLARWMFGPADEAACFAGRDALPGADVEDRAAASVRHGRVTGQLFLSLSTFGYHRRELVACERGSIWWDMAHGDVRVLREDGASLEGMAVSPGFDLNRMYVDELRDLLEACAGERPVTNGLDEALSTLAIVDALRESAGSGVIARVARTLPERAPADVRLRPFAERDLARTLTWMSDPAIYGPFLRQGPPSPEGHRAWFASLAGDAAQRVMAVDHDGRHVGNCGLKGIDERHRRAELWLYVGERARHGAGVGTAATRALVEHAFGPLGLDKLFVHVAADNPAARRVYEKAGFALEGLLRDELLIDGRRVSVWRMGRRR